MDASYRGSPVVSHCNRSVSNDRPAGRSDFNHHRVGCNREFPCGKRYVLSCEETCSSTVRACSSGPMRPLHGSSFSPMKIKCPCGHENVTLMPFDDPITTWIKCTRACQQARQLKAEMAVVPVREKLTDAFPLNVAVAAH